MRHTLIGIINRWILVFVLFPLQIGNAHAAAEQTTGKLNNIKPALSDSSSYNEYWLQYFLFEDGAYLTTQFSIVNFPFNKHKAIMLSTLITPDGKRYIIQNGRGRDDWTFDPDRLNITYSRDINHNIQGEFPNYSLTVHNTMAEVELSLKSSLPRLDHKGFFPDKKQNMSASIYAPHFEATGKWRLGEEAGVTENGPWTDFSKGEGFGIHVLIDGNVDHLMDNWLRVFGIKGKDSKRLILSSILRPDGNRDNILVLHDGNKICETFTDIQVKIVKEQKDDDDGTFPKQITIKARNGRDLLEGTINLTKKIQHFRLNDHVSTLEKLVLSALPTFTRYHYVADYDLILTTDEGEQKITGNAISEFTQIDAPIKRKKKWRRHR